MGQCHKHNHGSVRSIEFAVCFCQIPEHFIWRATELTAELKLQPKTEPQQWSSTAWPQLWLFPLWCWTGNAKLKKGSFIHKKTVIYKKRGNSFTFLLIISFFEAWEFFLSFICKCRNLSEMKARIPGDSRDFTEWVSLAYYSTCSEVTACSLYGKSLQLQWQLWNMLSGISHTVWDSYQVIFNCKHHCLEVLLFNHDLQVLA